MVLVPLVQSWSQIVADFHVNWLVYLSMPLVAAFVGYSTKLLALQMLYKPLEYRGIGPIGWQGVLPRRAGKVASNTITTLRDKLLNPEELLEEFDVHLAFEEMREPLTRVIDQMARDLTELVRPGLWDGLPGPVRRTAIARIHAVAPRVADNLVSELKENFDVYLDIHNLAVTILVNNKQKLNDLMKGIGGAAMTFVRRSGIYFGLVIGLIQMVAWGYFHNAWIMPAFGFFTGFASDWLALNLLFIPREPIKILRIVPLRGVIQQARPQVTADYARIIANDIFAPEVVLEAVLNGPNSDRLFHVVEEEISKAIDDVAGVAAPVTSLVIGRRRYSALKQKIVDEVIERLPARLDEAKGLSSQKLDVETMLVEKMNRLSSAEFEGIMRPMFKDDEMLMVLVGAVLGFLVGELQVVVVEHFGRHVS